MRAFSLLHIAGQTLTQARSLNTLVDYVEQFLDILLGNAGEGYAQVGLGGGNGADTVLVQQMDAQFFGFHRFQLQTHEVTGVERVVIPG